MIDAENQTALCGTCYLRVVQSAYPTYSSAQARDYFRKFGLLDQDTMACVSYCRNIDAVYKSFTQRFKSTEKGPCMNGQLSIRFCINTTILTPAPKNKSHIVFIVCFKFLSTEPLFDNLPADHQQPQDVLEDSIVFDRSLLEIDSIAFGIISNTNKRRTLHLFVILGSAEALQLIRYWVRVSQGMHLRKRAIVMSESSEMKEKKPRTKKAKEVEPNLMS